MYLTCGSTSIYEAEICGKPCAVFEQVKQPQEWVMYGLDEFYSFSSINEISDDLITMIYDRMNNNPPIYEKYLGKVDGKATENVVEAAEMIYKDGLEKEIEKYAKSISKSSKRVFLRQVVYERVTFIMTKTGLVYRLKYPHSAYHQSNDIPYSRESKWIKDL